jgi:hypothetical protein
MASKGNHNNRPPQLRDRTRVAKWEHFLRPLRKCWYIFIVIWYFHSELVYITSKRGILSFGIFFQVLVCAAYKNLATLVRTFHN